MLSFILSPPLPICLSAPPKRAEPERTVKDKVGEMLLGNIPYVRKILLGKGKAIPLTLCMRAMGWFFCFYNIFLSLTGREAPLP